MFTRKIVLASKDRSILHPVFGVPDDKPISKQILGRDIFIFLLYLRKFLQIVTIQKSIPINRKQVPISR